MLLFAPHCYSVWKFWSSSFTTNKRETDFCSSIFSSVQVECLKLWLIFFLYVGTGSLHCDYCWQWGIRAVDNQVWPALLLRNICLTSISFLWFWPLTRVWFGPMVAATSLYKGLHWLLLWEHSMHQGQTMSIEPLIECDGPLWQIYVATCSPARDTSAGYIAWGHSTVVGPVCTPSPLVTV